MLTPEATEAQVAELLAEGEALGTYSICISPSLLPLPRQTALKVATVCGFPSGAVPAKIKAAEAELSVAQGADEIDMVVNLGLVKTHDWAAVQAEIAQVRQVVPQPKVLKVIIESAALSDEEIIQVSLAAKQAQADFVKTSTGFHPAGGASVHAVELMAKTVAPQLGVKASGGIRDAASAQAMIEAGATRLGLSASAKVLSGFDD